MKTLRLLMPVIVIILTLMNLLSSWVVNNDAAFSANITALFGWLYIAVDVFDRNRTNAD